MIFVGKVMVYCNIVATSETLESVQSLVQPKAFGNPLGQQSRLSGIQSLRATTKTQLGTRGHFNRFGEPFCWLSRSRSIGFQLFSAVAVDICI